MSGFAPFNPYLAESALVHRVAVDRLKWQLGEPLAPYWPSSAYCLPAPLDSDWPLLYQWPTSYPGAWAPPAASGQYHYSMGFRDGLSASRGDVSGGQSGASTPAASPMRKASPTAASAGAAAADYPGDLMAFPSAGYRRTLSSFPVSTDTSYDNLTLAWPYGCKPFYFRHADPPSVRYC